MVQIKHNYSTGNETEQGNWIIDTGMIGLSRETREGWPLLTVETEMNGNSKSTNERGPSFGPVQNSKCFFSLPYNSFVPIVQQAGSPVSLCVFLDLTISCVQ